jgi:XTP/dITP diphosphohydrolase
MTHPRRLLLATTNPGKIREYRQMLDHLPCEVVTLENAGIGDEVEETGATIQENAVIKAKGYAGLSGMLTIADDSGLEVDALNGEPGVKSARYAGDEASDEDRIAYLLGKLEGVPDDRRQARFRCVIAITGPGLPVETSEGTCEGVIARAPKGAKGFGYDPIFYIPELNRHMAEIALDRKNRISHRGRAMAGARHIVERLVGVR